MSLVSPADLARLANDTQSRLGDVVGAISMVAHVTGHGDGWIRTTTVTLRWNAVCGYWYPDAAELVAYTRDQDGREVPVRAPGNLNGRSMTVVEARESAVLEQARSGCTVVHSAVPIGGAR